MSRVYLIIITVLNNKLLIYFAEVNLTWKIVRTIDNFTWLSNFESKCSAEQEMRWVAHNSQDF